MTQLEDALQDRPGARDAFVRALMPLVRARVLRVLRSRAPTRLNESDDVVQTVWWVLWRDDARVLRAYSEARGASLEGYVGMVAEREAGHALQRVTALRRGAQALELIFALVLLSLVRAPAQSGCPAGQYASTTTPEPSTTTPEPTTSSTTAEPTSQGSS